MSITLAQVNYGGPSDFPSTTIYSYFAATAAGGFIVAQFAWTPHTVPAALVSVTDTAGHVYHHAGSAQVGGVWTLDTWYAFDCAAATDLYVRATFAALVWGEIMISEWSGLEGTEDPLADADSAVSASQAAPYDLSLGVVTPAAAGDLIVAGAFGAQVPPWPNQVDTEAPGSSTLGGYVLLTGRYRLAANASAYDAAISLTGSHAMLGSVAVFTPRIFVWVDIPNFHAHEWLNASEYPGGAARVLCDLWTTAAGVTMKARLVSLLADDTTIDAVVGTSAEVTATVPTDASFDVVLAGRKQHKLQVRSDPTDTDLWCAPGAKVVP